MGCLSNFIDMEGGLDLKNLSVQYVLVWLCFFWVAFKSVVFKNRPTLEDTSTKTPEEAKRLRKQNHIERLTTAVLYVPFVPGAAILSPLVTQLFILIMNWKGLGEFLQIVAPLSDEQRRKEREKGLVRDVPLDATDRSFNLLFSSPLFFF